MAKTIARCRILSKSDKLGKKDVEDKDKWIRYFCVISFDKIDFTILAKELDGGIFMTHKDIDVDVNSEYFAITEVGKNGVQIKDILTRDEYLESLGL